MVRRVFRLNRERETAFDIVSYGRRVPGQPTRFTREQIDQIARTVRRVPEVMVKVSGGAKTTRGAEVHFQYISRQGELEVETDDGERLQGKDVAAKWVEDWDLEIDAGRARDRGAPASRLASAGLGLVAAWDGWEAELFYGRRLEDPPVDTHGDLQDRGIHFSLRYRLR